MHIVRVYGTFPTELKIYAYIQKSKNDTMCIVYVWRALGYNISKERNL